MKYLLTSSLGRGRRRTTTLSRVSTIMLQPCEQFGQTDAVRSSSQARALFSESLESSAPTGQRSMTFPAHGCVRSLPFELADERAVAALADVEHRIVRDVVHEPHAARAENAAVRRVHHVAAEILDRIESLGIAIATLGAPFLVGVVLQLALARLIADRAVERMIDEQHLEHALARLERLLGVDVDDLPFGDRRRARRRELRRLLDFDEAHAAHAGHRAAPGGSSSAARARRRTSRLRGSTCPPAR